MTEVDKLVHGLGLLPHPEGGWYRETYRSDETIPISSLPMRFSGDRNVATAIYFLLTATTFSALHRIKSDELWHFYAGSTLLIHVFTPDGGYHFVRLGSNLDSGESFQVLVPQGCWFGAEVEVNDGFALVGCTVAPGFDFADFELAERTSLQQQYPQHQALIKRLTRC